VDAASLVYIITFSVVGALVSAAVATLSNWIARLTKRAEAQERSRLRSDVLGMEEPTRETRPRRERSSQQTPKRDGDQPEERTAPTAAAVGPDNHRRFTLLLIDYYAFGITQARRSFSVSLSFSILGGLVLVGGLVLAIFRAETRGQVDAAAITSLAGALTSGIGALFHRQAARALRHMEGQTNGLRQDMKTETDKAAARELLGEVQDEVIRRQLQAALILRFTGAQLSDVIAPANLSVNGQMSANQGSAPKS
jgi:hypothetical protein